MQTAFQKDKVTNMINALKRLITTVNWLINNAGYERKIGVLKSQLNAFISALNALEPIDENTSDEDRIE